MHLAPCTLHLAPCTLHLTPCNLRLAPWHLAPCTLQLAPCTLHLAPCSLHLAPCTLHLAPCTLHFALCTLHCMASGCRGTTTTDDDDDKAACKVQHGLEGGNRMRVGTGTSLPRGCAARWGRRRMRFALLAFMRLGGKVVKGRRALEGGGEGWSLFPSVCKMRRGGHATVCERGRFPYPPAGSVGRHSTLAWIPNSKMGLPVDVVLARSSPLPHPRSSQIPIKLILFVIIPHPSPSFPIYAVAVCL